MVCPVFFSMKSSPAPTH
jgi:hypothetical protein